MAWHSACGVPRRLFPVADTHAERDPVPKPNGHYHTVANADPEPVSHAYPKRHAVRIAVRVSDSVADTNNIWNLDTLADADSNAFPVWDTEPVALADPVPDAISLADSDACDAIADLDHSVVIVFFADPVKESFFVTESDADHYNVKVSDPVGYGHPVCVVFAVAFRDPVAVSHLLPVANREPNGVEFHDSESDVDEGHRVPFSRQHGLVVEPYRRRERSFGHLPLCCARICVSRDEPVLWPWDILASGMCSLRACGQQQQSSVTSSSFPIIQTPADLVCCTFYN